MINIPRHGFTLIELLVALSLSVIILLVAIVTFRTATEAMADLDRLTNENALIRAGYFALTEDVDYWHSHANPAFPYLRSHAVVDEDPESLYGIRPFRRVSWPKDLDDPHNPNWRQPHDPRSWYRNGLTANTFTGAYRLTQRGNSRASWDVELKFDPTIRTVGAEPALGNPGGIGFFDTEGGVEEPYDDFYGKYEDFPAGWEWWHLGGDWASLSNIDGWAVDANNDGSFSESERSVDGFDARHDHPQGMARATAELGYWGVDSYLPPGTMSLLLASSVNRSAASDPFDSAINYRRGEIPWMLFSGGDSLETGVITKPPGMQIPIRRGGNGPAYPDNLGRANWFALMPDHFDTMRAPWKIGPAWGIVCDLGTFDGEAAYRTFRFLKADTALDGDSFNSTFSTMARPTATEVSTQTMVFPSGPLPKDFGQDWNTEIYNWNITRPIQGILGGSTGDTAATKGFSEFRFAEVLTTQQLDPVIYRQARDRETAWTWHVPPAFTGDPNPDLSIGDAEGRRMATGIFRERFHGQDRAECQILVTDVDSGTAFRMKFNLLGTNYRGARQYWGRVSSDRPVPIHAGSTDSVVMGDVYE